MAFQSRWGWHPCDYETFVLLKRLYAAHLRALRRYAAWERWRRNQPQNRVIRRRVVDHSGRKVGAEVLGPRPEPPLPRLFCVRRQVVTYWGEDGRPLKEGRPAEEVVFDDLGVPEAFRAARRPRATAEEAAPLRLSAEDIRRLAAGVG